MTIEYCTHCNDSIPASEKIVVEDKSFCCQGCSFVYALLNNKGMQNYYSLKEDSVGGKPVESSKKYDYLDHQDFKKDYTLKREEKLEFSFYIEGIHCTACLWLLEKLSDFNCGVISSELDMTNSVLQIIYSEEAKLSQIAVQITRLGYTPHPVLNKKDSIEFEKKENKADLIRIGVAFACAGNIMLYSFSVYLGAPKDFADYFNLFSFIGAIPVLAYCSIPFYKVALGSFRSKTISVDLPIVIVLLLSFVAGVISLVSDYELYYFDTISVLVFLLLSSRYLLNQINKKAISLERVSNYFHFQTAVLITDVGEQEVLASYLKVGDKVKIPSNSLVPSDCEIISGKSNINNAAITGESEPVDVKENDFVYMGAFNNDKELICKVLSTSENSRIGKIMTDVEKGWSKKNILNSFIDKTTKYFTISVLILASIFFLYFAYTQTLEIAVIRSFSLLLITCPCALALSTPLAMILSLSIFLKEGIYIKSDKTLERLTKIKSVYFDKTGTLTDGKFNVTSLDLDSSYLSILYSLEKKSNHPIAKSVVDHISKFGPFIQDITVEDFKVLPGKGVKGLINNKKYYLGKSDNADAIENEIILREDQNIVLTFCVEDSLNVDSKRIVKFLNSKNIETYILSGDRKKSVEKVGTQIGIDLNNIYFEQTPEDKIRMIESAQNALMIGDGVNDSSAIQKAFVGVAVSGSVESSLKAANVYLSKAKIDKLQGLFMGSHKAISIVKRNLIFSLIYNLFGVYLAFNGDVSPLLAAIFMPISSITILVSTLISTRRIKLLIND